MRGTDKVRIAAAQLSGLALACVQVRRLSDDEALAEMADVVAGLPAGRRQTALDQAAASYVDPGPTDAFHAAAAGLLQRAGADLDQALALRRERGQSFVVTEGRPLPGDPGYPGG